MRKKIVKVVLVTIGMVVLVSVANAEVPQYMNFQGTLIDTSQTPNVPVNGQKDIIFRLYNVVEGGNAIWVSQVIENVEVENGIFNILLGGQGQTGGTLFSHFDGNERWITMQVNEENTTESARQKISSVPLTTNDTTRTSGHIGLSLHESSGIGAYYDNARVRKNVSPEPTFGIPPNAPTSPQCISQTTPTNITDYTPNFSWVFSDSETGDTQSAYRILVATSAANLSANNGNMWDTGKITGSSGSAVYSGTNLNDGATYYWKVQTWDSFDKSGSYTSAQSFKVAPFPTGWAYSKQLNITNTGSKLNDYQFFISTITLNIAGLKSSGYLQSDYDDLRFADTNIKELNYWIEYSTSACAGFWVRVSTISAGTSTIYMYYGNSEIQVPASSGTNTFVHFDDFLGSSLSSDWSGTGTVSGGVMSHTGNEIVTASKTVNDFRIRSRSRSTSSTAESTYFFRGNAFNSAYSLHDCSIVDTWTFAIGEDATSRVNTTNALTTNTWHVYDITMVGGAINAKRLSDTTRAELNTNIWTDNPVSKTSGKFGFRTASSRTQEVDWIAVCKCASPEPNLGIAPSAPASPQCMSQTNPTNITDYTPDFSWVFSDSETGDTQSAFRILVSTSQANLNANIGELWDSYQTSASSYTYYTGSALNESTTYYWKVRTWDSYGKGGNYCSYQTFKIAPFPMGWSNYRQINIYNSGSVLNDYQFFVSTTNVKAGTLKSGGYLQSDYDDLRFTDTNIKKLNYWIEPDTSSAKGFWVKVSTINASGNTTIYMYYGNPEASNSSSISATFIFGDDFTTNTSGLWTVTPPASWTWDTGQGILTASVSGALTSGWAVRNAGQSDNLIIESKFKVNSAGASADVFGGVSLTANTSTGTSERYYFTGFRGNDTAKLWQLDAQIAWKNSASFSWSTGTWYRMKMLRSGTSIYGKIWLSSGEEPASWTINSSVTSRSNTYAGLVCEPFAPSSYSINCSFDDVRVRKYVSAEPTCQVVNPPASPTNPLCKGQSSPVIVSTKPDFSWTFSDPDTGDYQSGYRILVSSATGNIWDSGKIFTSSSTNVAYNGPTLIENTSYYWKIMTWDKYGIAGSYSSIQTLWTQPGGNFNAASINQGKPTELETSYTMLEKVINYPNPFGNGGTSFMYDVDRLCFVTIRIYTLAGRLVRELLKEESTIAGYRETYWDGKDSGIPPLDIGNGVYLYRISVKDWDGNTYSKIGKCVVMR